MAGLGFGLGLVNQRIRTFLESIKIGKGKKGKEDGEV